MVSADPEGLRLLLLLLIAVSLFRYLHILLKVALEAPFIDFAHYYTYATVVAAGGNPLDPLAAASVDALLGLRRAQAPANYPPPFYLLMQPWTWLPFGAATLGWLAVSQGMLAAAISLLRRRLAAASPLRVAAVLFVVFTFQPVVEDLALGQVNLFLLFLVTLGWRAAAAERPWVAALAVAATPMLKIQYALLLPFLWWAGHGPILRRALLLVAGTLALSLLLLGPTYHLQYLAYLVSLPDDFFAREANLALRGVLLRVFGPTGAGPLLASLLTLACAATLLYLLAQSIPRRIPSASRVGDWSWGLAVTAVPLLSPFTEEHHLAILLLPLSLLLLDNATAWPSGVEAGLLVASILLLGGRYSLSSFPAFQHGLPALLTAGKLLGAVALAGILLRRLRADAAAGAP